MPRAEAHRLHRPCKPGHISRRGQPTFYCFISGNPITATSVLNGRNVAWAATCAAHRPGNETASALWPWRALRGQSPQPDDELVVRGKMAKGGTTVQGALG